MKPKVYIETSVISYLVAWRSPQLIMAANQEATRQWWDEQRDAFEMYVSAIVRQEASAGDADAARRRLEVVDQMTELEATDDAVDLAERLVHNVSLPQKAEVDALLIAIAAINGMDYLLTWNCRHIANATLRAAISDVIAEAGYEAPIICTPLELIEDSPDD